MFETRRPLGCLVLFLGFALLSSPAYAQLPAPTPETAFVADFSTNRIFQVDFSAGTTFGPINNDANGLKQVRDILVSDFGSGGLHLIGADYNGGEVFFYRNAQGIREIISPPTSGSFPAKPDGLSRAPSGDLYLVNTGPGGSVPKELWRIRFKGPDAASYHPPERIEVVNGVDALVETEVLTSSIPGSSSFKIGGVFVATNRKVFFYPNAASGSSSGRFLVADFTSGPISEITGMALNLDGTLLLTDIQGTIYNVDLPSGQLTKDKNGNVVRFAQGLGTGAFKIDVGLQPVGPSLKAVLILGNRGQGSADRLLIVDSGLKRANNTPILVGQSRISVTANLSHPMGVAIGGGTIVPRGLSTQVQSSGITTVSYTEVTNPGLLNCRVFLVPETEAGNSLGSLDPQLATVNLPAHIQGFPAADPPHAPSVVVVVCKTTVSNKDVVNHLAKQGLTTVADPCDPNDPAHFLWTPIPGLDDPIVEGTAFIFATTDCDPRGSTRGTSVFLVDAGSDLTFGEIIDDQLMGLSDTLSALANYVKNSTKNKLKQLLNAATADHEDGDDPAALAHMEDFIAQIDKKPGDFNNTVTNVIGNVRARARSLSYYLCGATAADSDALLACAH